MLNVTAGAALLFAISSASAMAADFAPPPPPPPMVDGMSAASASINNVMSAILAPLDRLTAPVSTFVHPLTGNETFTPPGTDSGTLGVQRAATTQTNSSLPGANAQTGAPRAGTAN